MSHQVFSHVDSEGRLTMVDVSDKASTRRIAEARCVVVCDVDIFSLPASLQGFSPVVTARLEGISAAKDTAHLIPLCHPLALHDVAVDIAPHRRGALITSRVTTVDRTGVEMEALTACSFAALGLLSFALAVDPAAHMDDVVVTSKSGGASGDWQRHESQDR